MPRPTTPTRRSLKTARATATAALAAAAWLQAHAAVAGTLAWDPSHTPASPSGGTGTWDTNTTPNWAVGASDTVWTDTTGTDTAVFGGTAGTVTLAGTETANRLVFNTSGYLLTGGTLNLAGSTPTITANANAQIASVITGSNGLTLAGAGTLTLTGSNTYAGTTTIGSGSTLQIGNGPAARWARGPWSTTGRWRSPPARPTCRPASPARAA